MRRDIFTPEHTLFREQFRRFAEKEIAPKVAQWNERGMSDRETWRRCGEAGFLGANQPVEYGGAGGDFLYDAIIMEEMADLRAHAMMISLHSDIILPYLTTYGSEEQKRRYVPGAIRGEILLGIAMTEPGTGSDLANVQTRARRDGDHYVINGAKTFISNGQIGDLFIVVCRTDPDADPPHKGISLHPGRGRHARLRQGPQARQARPARPGHQRAGLRRLPRARCPTCSASEGQGFRMLMEKLQQERLCIAVGSLASCRRALDDTIAYVKQRQAFGQPIAAFQNTQFKLAELATEVEIGQAFIDKLLVAHVRGDEIVTEVSMAKWWTTDLQKRLTSECLQLHGGYGFMLEYPIAMDYADAAVQSIYAGTNEIMKVIIARRMGLG